jgi:hypothetical protein
VLFPALLLALLLLVLTACGSAAGGETEPTDKPEAQSSSPSAPSYKKQSDDWLDDAQADIEALYNAVDILKIMIIPEYCDDLETAVEGMRELDDPPARAGTSDPHLPARKWREGLRHFADAGDECALNDERGMKAAFREAQDAMTESVEAAGESQ